MSDEQVEEAARLFGLLAEPARLKLLRALMKGGLTVTELVEATTLKQGNVSKHLGVLREARFVARTKEGNFARYTLADPAVFQLCELMCNRMAADARARQKKLA